MDCLIVTGGRPLQGTVQVGGAKNASLPLLAATLLGDGQSLIERVPRLSDVDVMLEILRTLGVGVGVGVAGDGMVGGDGGVGGADLGGRTLEIDATHLSGTVVPDSLVRRMRSSIFLMGPLLARFGDVTMSHPGGCSIGPRPIDLHLKGLRAMGATIEERGPIIRARVKGRGRLRGADISLALSSVGATENLMMAATLAEGRTTIRNAAREPEIVNLADCLNAMGAHVTGAGSDIVRVDGVSGLHGARQRAIPDRIEAGTLLIAIAATGGAGTVSGCRADHLDAVLSFLRDAGCEVAVTEERTETNAEHAIAVRGPERPMPVDLRTQPYPGYPTDLQNPALALLLRAAGTSVVSESVFENRFQVAEEVRRMGASLSVDGRSAIVRGVPALSGAWVEARELRGGAALVIAALSASGESCIDGVDHIDRGYEAIETRLQALGADVRRQRSD